MSFVELAESLGHEVDEPSAEVLSKRPDGLMVFDILHNIQKDEWYVILPTDMVDGCKLQFYMEE